MKHLQHLAAVAVAGGVAVAPLAAPAAPAAAHPAGATSRATTNAEAAAGYLASHLAGRHHDHYSSSYVSGGTTYTYVNYGETADAILSMDAAGAGQSAARRATSYLVHHVTSYIGTGGSGGYSPGAIGKVLLVAEAQHHAVRSFGGVDLVAALDSVEGSGDAQPGEFQQNPPGTAKPEEFYSTVGQALPVLALANTPRAGQRPDQAAVSFLAAQQCSDGGYPTQLLTTPSDACAAGEDVDSTAYAVQALLAAGAHQAADLGLSFLQHARHANGGFGSPTNANSTALAVQALVAGHLGVAKPVGWLRRHQVGCGGAPRHRGAVRFAGRYDDRALLATSQAGAALALRPLAWIDSSGASHRTPALRCARK